MSAQDPRVHFGLGGDADLAKAPIEKLVITWPGGASETFDAPKVDQLLRLVEGSGKPMK